VSDSRLRSPQPAAPPGAGAERAGAQPAGAKPVRRPREVASSVLEIEAAAIRGLLPQIDESFDQAVGLLGSCRGRVVCTGMGKSGLILRKVAATLSSTGTPALFLHPAEAIHGDLGAVVAGDVVLAGSFTGRTQELLRLAELLKRLSIPLVVATGDAESPLALLADVHLPMAIDQEACPLNLAPTASTAALLALGDALAMALLEARGFTPDDFARLHPGGSLGWKLRRVKDSMRSGDAVPRVLSATPMREAIVEMSRKGLGITAVTEEGDRLVGVITDGDLRRLLERGERLLDRTASACMTGAPKTVGADDLASAALKKMEDHHITALLVCDAERRLQGILHLHDLWGLELF
jgi:arabinose-5-phosphate isomerase